MCIILMCIILCARKGGFSLSSLTPNKITVWLFSLAFFCKVRLIAILRCILLEKPFYFASYSLLLRSIPESRKILGVRKRRRAADPQTETAAPATSNRKHPFLFPGLQKTYVYIAYGLVVIEKVLTTVKSVKFSAEYTVLLSYQ